MWCKNATLCHRKRKKVIQRERARRRSGNRRFCQKSRERELGGGRQTGSVAKESEEKRGVHNIHLDKENRANRQLIEEENKQNNRQKTHTDTWTHMHFDPQSRSQKPNMLVCGSWSSFSSQSQSWKPNAQANEIWGFWSKLRPLTVLCVLCSWSTQMLNDVMSVSSAAGRTVVWGHGGLANCHLWQLEGGKSYTWICIFEGFAWVYPCCIKLEIGACELRVCLCAYRYDPLALPH